MPIKKYALKQRGIYIFRQPCPMHHYGPMTNPYMTNPHMLMMVRL